jgi:TRAP-type C4-dicarboxylate transport system permease small subunit
MAAEVAAVSLLVLLVVVTTLGVLDRFVLGMGLVWTEELARYLLLWTSFLAAIVATRRSQHFKVEFLSSALGPIYARLVVVISLAICLVAVWYGVQFAWFFRSQTSPALGISMTWVYACAPVGFAGMAIYLVRDLLAPQPDAPASPEGREVH